MFGLTARKPLLGGKVFQPQKPAPKPAGSSQASASSQPKPSESETETETERLPEEHASQSQSVLNEATQPLRIIPIAQQSSGPDDKQTGPTRLIVIPSTKPSTVAIGATKLRSAISAPSAAANNAATAANVSANAAPLATIIAPVATAASTSSSAAPAVSTASKAESEEKKPAQNKVLSFPLSVKKKSSLAASSSGEKGPEIDVDKIIESALVLQQMSSHKLSAAKKTENKFEDKADSETDPSFSDDDMDDTLAAHFGTGKAKRAATTRKAKTQSAVAAAYAAVPKRAPGRKKYTTTPKERKAKENEDDDEDEDEEKDKAKAKPKQKRKSKDSATSAESSAPSSSSSSDPAPKRKKSTASKESTEEKPKKIPKAKASKLLSLFPSSFGETKRVQRVTCYVRIDQHGVDGLTFVNEDERPVVAEISPSFPNTAGVRLRDVIVSVNNLDGRRAKFDQLMDALICKNPPKPKDPMAELSGVIPKNAVYDTMACIVFARPLPEAPFQID